MSPRVYGPTDGSFSVAIGDLNTDGRPDLAITSAESDVVSVFLGNGTGSFTRRIDYGTGHYPRYVAIGDLNSDGRPDLVVGNRSANTVSVLWNRSGPTPVEVFDFVAQQRGTDVWLSWRTRLESEVRAFRIFRSRAGDAFEPLAPDIEPNVQTAYSFVDVSPQPARYAYRLSEVTADGAVVLHATVEIDVVRVVPQVTFLAPAAPNPFNSATTLSVC
jgi:hypothetical protein